MDMVRALYSPNPGVVSFVSRFQFLGQTFPASLSLTAPRPQINLKIVLCHTFHNKLTPLLEIFNRTSSRYY